MNLQDPHDMAINSFGMKIEGILLLSCPHAVYAGLKLNEFANGISWHEDKKLLQAKSVIDLFVCLCFKTQLYH